MASLVVVDFVELVEESFEGFHDLEAEQVVDALQTTDTDAFVEYVEGFKSEDFFFLFQVIKAKGRLNEDGAFGTGKGDDLVQEISEEGVAVLVLESGHWDVVVVVEFLVTYFLEYVKSFLHVCVTVD